MANVISTFLIPSSESRPEEEIRILEEPNKSGRKKVHTARWDRCVDHVKAKGGGYNAYAVCTGRMKRSRAFLKSSR